MPGFPSAIAKKPRTGLIRLVAHKRCCNCIRHLTEKNDRSGKGAAEVKLRETNDVGLFSYKGPSFYYELTT